MSQLPAFDALARPAGSSPKQAAQASPSPLAGAVPRDAARAGAVPPGTGSERKAPAPDSFAAALREGDPAPETGAPAARDTQAQAGVDVAVPDTPAQEAVPGRAPDSAAGGAQVRSVTARPGTQDTAPSGPRPDAAAGRAGGAILAAPVQAGPTAAPAARRADAPTGSASGAAPVLAGQDAPPPGAPRAVATGAAADGASPAPPPHTVPSGRVLHNGAPALPPATQTRGAPAPSGTGADSLRLTHAQARLALERGDAPPGQQRTAGVTVPAPGQAPEAGTPEGPAPVQLLKGWPAALPETPARGASTYAFQMDLQRGTAATAPAAIMAATGPAAATAAAAAAAVAPAAEGAANPPLTAVPQGPAIHAGPDSAGAARAPGHAALAQADTPGLLAPPPEGEHARDPRQRRETARVGPGMAPPPIAAGPPTATPALALAQAPAAAPATPEDARALQGGDFAISGPDAPRADRAETATLVPARADPRAPQTAAQIGQQMAAAARQSAPGTVELRLHPEELGRLHLQFDGTEKALVITITAERPETGDLMRRHIDQLAREMQAMGYRDVAFRFSGGDGAPGGGGHARPDAQATAAARDAALPDLSSPSLPPSRPPQADAGLDLRI